MWPLTFKPDGEVTLRKSILCLAAIAGLGVSGAAQSAITVAVVPGTNPYAGPAPTFDFETGATTPIFTGGQVQSGSNSVGAAPFPGNLGRYYTVGPAPGGGSPGVIDLSGFGAINAISFVWGSVDTYNDLDFLAADGTTVLATFNGSTIAPPANGNQTSATTNPLVVFNLTGTDATNFTFLRLRSTQQAFEIDNLAINPVPEPGTWALLILGFGAIGAAMRRRTQQVRSAKAKLHFA